MHVLLYLERLVGCLHHHTYIYVESFGSLRGFLIIFAVNGKLRVIGILHPTALIFFVSICINAFFHELLIQFVQ